MNYLEEQKWLAGVARGQTATELVEAKNNSQRFSPPLSKAQRLRLHRDTRLSLTVTSWERGLEQAYLGLGLALKGAKEHLASESDIKALKRARDLVYGVADKFSARG